MSLPLLFRSRALLVLVVFAVVAAACSSSGITIDGAAPVDESLEDVPATPTPADAPTPAEAPTPTTGTGPVEDGSVVIEGRFELDTTPCTFDRPGGDVDTTCYTLSVPERWDLDADDDRVELHVGVFETPAASSETIVYLEGGPGGDALRGASLGWAETWAPLAADHRIVIFDQRGTGSSVPSLACSAVVELATELAAETDTDIIDRRTNDALAGCIDDLRADGVDFGAFNSVQSAHDVEALRLALGSGPWNLLGISYGTRLAQTVLREHPDGVRSAILDAVLPIDADFAAIPTTAERSFGELFNGCSGDAACATAYPDLEDRYWALVERLDADPIEFMALNPLTAESYPARWSGSDLVGVTFSMLYSRTTLVDIPYLVDQLETGDTSGASAMEGLLTAQEDFLSVGMFWSVACHEEVPYTTAEEYDAGRSGDARFDDVFATGQANADDTAEVCAILDAGQAEPVEDEPIGSSVPALVLSGQYDPITPPSFGQDVADDLANSTHVVLPATGHSGTTDDCGRQLILAFIADPAAPVQSCADTVEPLTWVADPAAPPAPLAELTVEGPLGGNLTVSLPETWEVQGQGAVVEGESVLRQGILLFLTTPPAQLSFVPELLFQQLGGDPVDAGTVEAGGTTWAATSGTIPGYAVDAWAGEVDGVGVVVVLQSAASERQRIIDTVIPTALETVRPS